MKKDEPIVTYKASQLPSVSADDIARLRAIEDEQIDFSDIPEISKEQWKNARLVFPENGIDALQIDPEIYHWFKRFGTDKNARINEALRSYRDNHPQ